MLYPLNNQRPPAPRVQKALHAFVRNIQRGAGAFSDELFPPWFKPVLNARGRQSALRAKAEKAFGELQRLTGTQKREFLTAFENHNEIQHLCENTATRVRALSPFPPSLTAAFAELTEHLYSMTLSKSQTCGEALGLTEPCIPWHFKRFRSKYKVCCFCGLTDYSPIGKERAQYDHYLHRSLYPLSTANGANLVPMCDRCNSMANKGQKDIIRKSGARRHAFFPYAPCSGVAVTARCLQPDRVQRNARWEVEVLPRTSAEREKVGTWLDVFRIKDRYQETLSTDSATWLQQQLSDWVESRSVKGVGNLRTFFRMKSQKLQEELPKTEKAIVMQAMFSHMASAQGSVLRGLIDNLQTAYASRSANRGKRTLTEQ